MVSSLYDLAGYENDFYFFKQLSVPIFAQTKLYDRIRSFLLEEKEFMQKLENAIASLSEKQREVFLLNRIDKKTYTEIAVFLDISKKAVEKRMHNALKVLRKEIGDI